MMQYISSLRPAPPRNRPIGFAGVPKGLFYLAMLLGSLCAPGRAWAQTLSVPLGQAAQFGLLAGDTLRTDATPAHVVGRAGARQVVSSTVSASDTLLTGTAPLASAFTGLQAAITYCQTQPTQVFHRGALNAGIVYLVPGNLRLNADTVVRLVGDSATQIIIHVQGHLRADSGTSVLLQGGLRPEHVFWLVDSTVRLRHMSNFAGVVLAQGAVSVRGFQFGRLALFSTHNITTGFLDATIGAGGFRAPAASAVGLLPLPPPQPGSGFCNELGRDNRNGAFEQIIRPLTGLAANMQIGGNEPVSWEGIPGGSTPDYHHADAPLQAGSSWSFPYTHTPNNLFGGQPVRQSGSKAYVGFYAYAAIGDDLGEVPGEERLQVPNSTIAEPNVADYIQRTIGYTRPGSPNSGYGPVAPAGWYYGEFYVSLAGKYGISVEQLGMCITNKVLSAEWANNLSQTLHEPVLDPVTGELVYSPLSPGLVPQVRFAAAPLNDTSNWVRVAGCFELQGDETEVIIGNFLDGKYTYPNGSTHQTYTRFNASALFPDRSYYYLDDVLITRFPQAATTDTVVLCGNNAILGSTCRLPDASNAIYSWTNDADGGTIVMAPGTTTLNVTPTQTTTYTLHVQVPVPGTPLPGQPTFWERSSSVTIRLAPYECRLDCAIAEPLPSPDFSTDQTLTGTFAVDQDVTIIGCTVTLAPGTQLLMAADTRILLYGATLVVEGATITSSCYNMWGGIELNGSRIETKAAASGRRAEISQSLKGITFTSNRNGDTPGTFSLVDTDFLNNLQSFSGIFGDPNTPDGQVPEDCRIERCRFVADPTGFLQPYSYYDLGTPTYALYHLALSGDYDTNRIRISNNYFGPAWLHIWAPQTLYIGAKENTFAFNRYRGAWVAGLYAGQAGWDTYGPHHIRCDTSDFALPTALTWPTDHAQWDSDVQTMLNPADMGEFAPNGVRLPGAPPVASHGMFLRGLGGITHLQRNSFHQPESWRYYNLPVSAPVYPLTQVYPWQVGAYVNDAPQSLISSNRFEWLHTGLRGLRADQSRIVDNRFDNCEYTILIRNSGGAGANRLCINCNSFLRNFRVDGVTPDVSLLGTSYGIYIENGAPVTIGEFVFGRPRLENVMGNRFANGTQLQSFAQGGQNYTYHGFGNAIYNGNSTSLLYFTYDNKSGYAGWSFADYALRPAAMLSQMWGGQPAATRINVMTYGTTTGTDFVVSATNNCKALGFRQGLQNPLRPSSSSGATTQVLHSLALDTPARVTDYEFGSAAPNPLSDETQVSYRLPSAQSSARVEVRDVTGRLVLTTPVPTQQTSGQMTLGLGHVPGGVYICRLLVGDVVCGTQRLLVLRL